MKNKDIALSWALTGIWAGISIGGIIDIGLGYTVSTFTLVVLYACLAVSGVLCQLWFRRYRLQKDLNAVLVAYAKALEAECDRD